MCILGLNVVKQGAARAMMDKLGDDGFVVDGRKLLFEYRYINFTFSFCHASILRKVLFLAFLYGLFIFL